MMLLRPMQLLTVPCVYNHSTGLKIISLNTDFWYTENIFNFYNFTNTDNSGVLKFLADELSASEAINQRVWIIGHVISGYDGSIALPNPSGTLLLNSSSFFARHHRRDLFRSYTRRPAHAFLR